MKPPTCIHPIFRDVIERHFPELKISPGNGNECVHEWDISTGGAHEIGIEICMYCGEEKRNISGDVRRGTANELATQERDKPSSESIPSVPDGPNVENARDAISRCVSPNVAQYLHYPILCMALLEENAILKRRLENLAKTDVAMFPR